MIRYSYNSQLQPPAPFIHVVLRNPADGTEVRDVPAQIDTAADRTVLPDALIQSLGLAQIGILSIGGLGGIILVLPAYAVWLGVHDRSPRAFKVVGSQDELWVLLGRDVINSERCLLDGPGLVLEID